MAAKDLMNQPLSSEAKDAIAQQQARDPTSAAAQQSAAKKAAEAEAAKKSAEKTAAAEARAKAVATGSDTAAIQMGTVAQPGAVTMRDVKYNAVDPNMAASPQAAAASAGAAEQMANYDRYAQQALGGSAEEAMQKAGAASAQTAQGVSDAAVQQAAKAARTSGAMGGQAALAATGQAAGAYGAAQQAARQEYFNTAQLGAQLGAEMSGRLQKTAADTTQRYATDVGAAGQRYSTDVGAASQQYGTDVSSRDQKYGTDVAAAQAKYGTDVGERTSRYNIASGAESSRYGADTSAAAAAAANKTAKRGQNIGVAGQAIGGIAGIASLFSDKNLKEDIAPMKATDGLSKIKAYSYKYKKGPAYAGGRNEAGIIAQDLEKTGMAPAVMDTPEGKMIDTNRLSTMNTGAIAEQQKNIEKILGYLKTMNKPEGK